MLQFVAVCCSVLQYVAVRRGVLVGVSCCILLNNTLYHTAPHCTTLQHTAACCSMLECVAVCRGLLVGVSSCMLQVLCVAVCCRVFQCVAVCCSMLQCVEASWLT